MLPTYLPALDADANEIAGVRTVLAQVPSGTYLGWNVFASGFDKGKFCSLTGSYIPFAETKQERLAQHDPRLSLEERYGTHEEYVNQVRNATARLAKAGFLLPDDAAKLLNEAEESDVLRNLRHMNSIRLGAGAGYSGDRIQPALDLVERGSLDYIVFECLAERTIALAQQSKANHPELGYDPMLAARIRKVLPACHHHGTKLISNMGATNPRAAARKTAEIARELGIGGIIADI